MKNGTFWLLVTIVVAVYGCRSRKAGVADTATSQPQFIANGTEPVIVLKPVLTLHVPTEAELTAIKNRFPDASMQKLKEGYFIYNEGACISCHGVFDIYQYSELSLKNIIDDMAQRAGISGTQKDVVYKYVLSVKATQP